MTEQKTKKRGWVKNAVIIFLAVMLVLVFFSNTIMNRSLPEVATQYTSSGQINAMIRGSGTAVANETFEVKIDQTRTILSTHIRVGDEVQSGQLLFRLQETESDELGTLREELENKEYNYRIAMLDASLNDGSQTNREIQRAREDLQAAQDAFDQMVPIPAEDIAAVKTRIDELKEQVTIFEIIRDDAQKSLDELGGLEPSSNKDTTLEQAWHDAVAAAAQAESAQKAVEWRFSTLITILDEIAAEISDRMSAAEKTAILREFTNGNAQHDAYILSVVKSALAEEFKIPAEPSDNLKVSHSGEVFEYDASDKSTIRLLVPIGGTSGTPYAAGAEFLKEDLLEAFQQIELAKAATQAAKSAASAALDRYSESGNSGNEAEYNRRKRFLDNAQANLDQISDDLTLQQKLLEQYETRNADYAAAKQNLRTLSDNLDNLLLQQRQQGVSQTKTAMELERQRADIEELKAKIEGMETGGEQTEVLAAVSGIVRSLNVSSGNKAQADAVLATIEVPDRGYTLNMSVSNEQAAKVAVGDMADVTSYYWGSNITAQLISIRNDPEKHGEGKLLLFNLTGNVESGSQYNLAIGTRSQYYDVIVPNSALHEDTNGTYVYVVEAKNSPLGNRYFVTRVDVTVLAKDDNNSAVSGSLSGWNSSVVTASPPLSNGMQVRLTENP